MIGIGWHANGSVHSARMCSGFRIKLSVGCLQKAFAFFCPKLPSYHRLICLKFSFIQKMVANFFSLINSKRLIVKLLSKYSQSKSSQVYLRGPNRKYEIKSQFLAFSQMRRFCQINEETVEVCANRKQLSFHCNIGIHEEQYNQHKQPCEIWLWNVSFFMRQFKASWPLEKFDHYQFIEFQILTNYLQRYPNLVSQLCNTKEAL